MRAPGREISYLVGTPKSRIGKREKLWLNLPWQSVRDSAEVKLYQEDGELYVLAKSEGRQAKEIAMRRKRLARLLVKLRAMRKSLPSRDQCSCGWVRPRQRRGGPMGLSKYVCLKLESQ